MSEESGAGPLDSGGQGQNLEGVSVLTWSADDVKAWLINEGYSKYIDSLEELNGKRLAQAKLVMLTKSLGGNEVIAMDLWGSVEALVRKQQKKNRFEDIDEYESIMETRGTPVQSAAGVVTNADMSRLVVQINDIMSAFDVRLTNWHDTSHSRVVKVSHYDGLRKIVGEGSKLYYFDESPGNPRGTVRVKVTNNEEFSKLRQQPHPVTVYWYTQHDNGPESPQGQPSAPVAADSSESSSRSTTMQTHFRTNVIQRYKHNQDSVVCLLCGKGEGELPFEACHIIPYSSDSSTFANYGITGGKTDSKNGVFFCHECHQFYDNGHWNWKVKDCDDHIEATVVVSEGLQEKFERWKSLNGKIVELGKGPMYPSLDVWEAGYQLNFLDPQHNRQERRKTKGQRCVFCGNFYKRNYEVHKCKAARHALFHSPGAEHPPRSRRGGRGRARSQHRGRGNAHGTQAPPVMPSLLGASPEPGDRESSPPKARQHPKRTSNLTKGRGSKK